MVAPASAFAPSYASQLAPDATAALRLEVPVARLADACAELVRADGSRLVTMVGLDDRAQSGNFRLVYLFKDTMGATSIETQVSPQDPSFPSVTARLPAAHWYEREVHDLLGLRPEGHPHLRRLVLHEAFPEAVHPLRKDFDASTLGPVNSGPPAPFHHLHGDGIVEIPVGPIHAGVIEPGHFRFAAVGELVLHLEARLFYTHRGMEKLAEGRAPGCALALAERLCGVCAMSHAASFCQAVEAATGTVIPSRAAAIRTLFLELERLYNHIGDLGNMCAGTSLMVGSMRGARLKEQLQQLNERLTGSRFLRNMCRLGGVRRDLTAEAMRDAVITLTGVRWRFDQFVRLLLGTESFMERLRGTGTLTRQAALDLGAVGVAARASGIALDARRDSPHAWYSQLDVPVVTETAGDVEARFLVRIAEATASFLLALRVLNEMPAGPITAAVVPGLPNQTGVGITESPRGENVHWVRLGPGGVIDRWR
ncbi:MAG: NADH-quinone oxidoreductase subunit C, partial [Chloroflexota bacterium]